MPKNEDVKNKLNRISGSGKLLFDIDGSYYVLCAYDTICEAQDQSLLNGAIRHYTKLNTAYRKELWNEENERLLLKSMHKIIAYLDEWDATPSYSKEIILSFNEDQLRQLEQQIEMYANIKELYRKYKSWH